MRRDQLVAAEAADPIELGQLTVEEIRLLVSKNAPQFRFYDDENFFPEDALFLTAQHGATTNVAGAQLDLPLVQFPWLSERLEYQTGVSPPDGVLADGVDSEDGFHWAHLSMVEDNLGTAENLFGSDPANDPRSPDRPVTIYAEFRDPLQALEADWRRRAAARMVQEELYEPATRSGFAWIGNDPDSEIYQDALIGPITIPDGTAGGDELGTGSNAVTHDMHQALAGEIAAPGASDASAVGLDEYVWRAAKEFVFLEYYLVYVYNDYSSHEDPYDAPLAGIFGDHEGDVEASAIFAFPRDSYEQALVAADRDAAIEALRPRFLIEMGHEYGGDHDYVVPLSDEQAIRDTQKVVYVAGGSHAAAPTSHSGPTTGFTEATQGITEAGSALAILAAASVLGPGGLFTAAGLLLLAESTDSIERRSDTGARIGAGPGTASRTLDAAASGETSPAAGPNDLVVRVIPTGPDRSGFVWPKHVDLSTVRSFPGNWGRRTSVRWRPKTGRALKVLGRHLAQSERVNLIEIGN